MLPSLSDYPYVAIDTETTGLDWKRERIFGIAVTTPESSHYFDIREEAHVIDWLRKEARHVQKVVNHNMKFDLHFLHNLGIELDPAICHCTMVRASLIHEHHRTYDLDSCAKRNLGWKKVDDIYQRLAELFGGAATRSVQAKNFHRAPVEIMRPYAIRDTDLAFKLFEWQEGEITRQGLHKVAQFEQRLFPQIFRMERHGIAVDVDMAERSSAILKKRAEQVNKELNDVAGFEVNPNPSGSIHQLFAAEKNEQGVWIARDGTPLDETDAGKPSYGEEALKRMTDPAAALILKCRKLKKASGTFLDRHVLMHQFEGRVYPNINQVKGESGGTATGRLSYTGPALQQIPSRDREMAAMIRPIFMPDEGHKWHYGDLEQHELRWFLHYVMSKSLVEKHIENVDTDMHQEVADLLGIPRKATATSGNANAKTLNLAMVFNFGEGTLCKELGLPTITKSFVDKKGKTVIYDVPGEEGQAVIDKYHAMVPGIREMTKRAKNVATKRGYIKTIQGRHLRCLYESWGRKMGALLYQSAGAEANKMNIITIGDILQGSQSHLLLNIHDEYSLSMHPDDVHLLYDIRHAIQSNPICRVPLRIDFGQGGDSWWDATIAKLHTTGTGYENNDMALYWKNLREYKG